MNSLNGQSRHNATLLKLSFFLIGLTAIEILWPHKPEIDLPPDNDLLIEEVAITINESANIEALSFYQAITASPLFTVDRTPYQAPVKQEAVNEIIATSPAVQEAEVIVAEETTFIIQGIIRSPRSQIALLQSDQSSVVQKVMINDEIEGWEVISIENNEVTLRKGLKEQNLLLLSKGESTQ